MAQSLSSLLVHLIFSTKHREPLMTPDVEPELFAYMGKVFRECKSPALAINGTSDHLLSLFVLARTIAVADLVEEVKKRSSKWLKRQSSHLMSFQWQAGYGAFSIGQSNVPAVKAYIARQKQHHRRRGFQDEFRRFLKKYEVEYDERYVWD